jgi:hypothetical protein
VLRTAYGQRWSETDAPQALGVYCAYILLLAVNGILEAFVHAVARSRCARPTLSAAPHSYSCLRQSRCVCTPQPSCSYCY